MTRTVRPLLTRLNVLLAAVCLGACAVQPVAQDGRLSGPSDADLGRILAAPRPPAVLVPAGEVPRLSRRAAARLSAEALAEQRGARRVEIAAVPLLRSTPAGAAFLAMEGHRALAQGEPAASCPALSIAPPSAPTPRLAALSALGACKRDLESRGRAAACGCRLLALDDALLAPLARFTFAPAVSALLIAGDRPRRMIAEAQVVDGVETIRLRTVAGTAGVLRGTPDGTGITGRIDGIAYTGQRQPFGFRRGRLAERLVLTAEDGRRASLLIGVERRDATP